MLIYLIIVFILFLVAFISFSVMAFYHLRRFGFVGDLTKPVMFVYSVIAILIIAISILLLIANNVGGN